MKPIVRSAASAPALCLALALAAAPAFAQEVIQTGNGGAPPVVTSPAAPAATPQPAPESDDAWAHRVLDAAAAKARTDAKAAPAASCAPPADNRPHGQVWAGVGSRGYRDVGGVVTQPVGACGSVTVMIDQTQGGGYGPQVGRAR